MGYVETIDCDSARRGVEEPRDEAQQGRLAASGLAHEGDVPTRLDREADVPENLFAGAVGEVDLVERDLTSQRWRGTRVRRILQGGGDLEHLDHPLGGSRRLCRPLHGLRGPLKRAIGGAEVADEDDQLAGGEGSVQYLDRSEREHQREATSEHQLDRAVHLRFEAGCCDALLEAAAVDVVEALLLTLARAVQLDDGHGGDGFMHSCRHLSFAFALLLGVDADPAAVEVREREDAGHHGQRHGREDRIDERHDDDHHHDQDHAGPEADDGVDENVAQQDDVGAQPHQHVSGLALLMEGQGQAVQVRVQASPDRVDDLLRRLREHEVLVVVGKGPHHADQRESQPGGDEDRVRRGAEGCEQRAD